MSPTERQQALKLLAEEIQSHENWWLFPTQQPIQGFMGAGPVFIVGDQPSMHEWPVEHPNRRLFYGTLAKVGLANAHLTDLYKKRGFSSELRQESPKDFSQHVRFFEKEIELLQPSLIIGLGQLAQRLLIEKVKTWRKPVPRIWHFSYVTRVGRESEYESHIRSIVGDFAETKSMVARLHSFDRVRSSL